MDHGTDSAFQDFTPTLNCCDSVFFAGNNLFSIQVTVVFVLSHTRRLCYYSSCTNIRSVPFAFEQQLLNKSQCKHFNKVKESATTKAEFYLTQAKVTEHPGSADIQSTVEATLNYSHQLGVPHVVRVSESSHAVCSVPDTYAENGFVHVKSLESRLQCSVTNCKWEAAQRPKSVHTCSITVPLPGLVKSSSNEKQLEPASTSAISASVDHGVEAASSVSRLATIRLNLSKSFPYNVPLDIINIASYADYRNFGAMDGVWPREFIPE